MPDYKRQGKLNKAKGYRGEYFVKKWLEKSFDFVIRIPSRAQKREQGIKSPDLIAIDRCGYEEYSVTAYEVKYRKNWKENTKETEALRKWALKHKIPVVYAIIEKYKGKRFIKLINIYVCWDKDERAS